MPRKTEYIIGPNGVDDLDIAVWYYQACTYLNKKYPGWYMYDLKKNEFDGAVEQFIGQE